ncbi:non-syndromic hearing impairment protein 5-like [Seriola dumerili]|uniref:non-syndromic hearing impairment protein 5-like n=1 Tax=Seriola dumerili TaxID=41447 RepID=UPI000BBE6F8E|nr:non-syndromic hearing impairment protein 5-like [Seriola dumerili]
MFSKATANFVRQIDPEGSLIHVSRVNDSQKLVPMALVVKRNRLWFWQRPKYQPTDFTLSDLLLGDKTLSPGLCETEFLTYKGTFGDKLSGKLKTKAGSVSVALEGQGTTKLQSCFGKLKKEELDVKKLLRDSRSRLVDMQHVLVQQLEKRADVLAVVKERIVTTNSCSITQTKKEQCIFQGVVGLLDILGSSVKVCVKDTNNIEMDSDVSLEIPSDTVIAYSILELEIKKNGHYDICLQPGTIGGFESDTWPSQDSLNVVDGKCNGENVPTLQNGSQEMDLSPLAELNQSTRCALFKKLQETMRDRTALSYLQCVLAKLCGDDTLDMANQDMDRLSLDIHSECSQAASPAHLNATHLLVSAMEELPDETLSLLSESRADFLEAFNTLMCRLKESSGTLSIQRLPILLQDNQTFQLAEQLLSSTNVTLKRNAESLWTETGDKAEALPLILCLSTHGLSLLCTGLK